MSRVSLKIACSALVVCSLSACSALPGSSMMSSLSPASLNPFSAAGGGFSGQSEPAIEADTTFLENDFRENDSPEDSGSASRSDDQSEPDSTPF